MTDISKQSISERIALIEDALAAALDIPGIDVEFDNGERQIVVAVDNQEGTFRFHSLWLIAREVERRIFPNG